MSRAAFAVGLLVGATHVFGCTNEREPYGSGSQPLLEASRSSRSDVVAVVTTQKLEQQLCTGIVILPNLVLTARHCLTVDRAAIEGDDCASAIIAEPPADVRVSILPASDVDLVPEDAEHVVSEYLLPEDESRLCGQDIALLMLASPLEKATLLPITPKVPIGVPDTTTTAKFTAVGYGLFDGDWGQQRERAGAPIVCAGEACADTRIASNELLTSSGACEGDSGGPAIDASGSVFALAARSSADCSESAYLTLASYAGWLKTATRYAAEAGEFDVPAWVTSADAVETPSDVTEIEPNAVDARARGGCTVTAPGNGRGTGAFVVLSLLFASVGIARRRGTVRSDGLQGFRV